MKGYEKSHVWYMWKRGKDELIIGDDIQKTQKDYFLGDRKPDLQMTEQELDDCGRMVRVIDGGIVVGKTEKEKEEDRKRAEMFAKMFPKPAAKSEEAKEEAPAEVKSEEAKEEAPAETVAK